MKRTSFTRKRMAAFVAATLAGGTLFGTCEMRVHDALIDGSKNFIYQLLSPSNLTDLLDNSSTDDSTDS